MDYLVLVHTMAMVSSCIPTAYLDLQQRSPHVFRANLVNISMKRKFIKCENIHLSEDTID